MKFKIHWIQIQLKKNEMQIDLKAIENMFMVMVLNFIFWKDTNPKKKHFYSSLLGNWLNISQFGTIIQKNDWIIIITINMWKKWDPLAQFE
jgi:hypothetical protein